MTPISGMLDGVPDIPDDPALPGLALLRHRTELAEILAPLLASRAGGQAGIRDSQVAIVRHVPGMRCIAALDVVIGWDRHGAPKRRRVIAKLFRRDAGAKVYDTVCRLWKRGFGAGRYRIPRPLAWEPDWEMVLIGWAEGDSLRRWLLTRPEAGPQLMTQAAGWLVKLHGCGEREGRRYDFGRHLYTLGVWQQRLTETHPAVAGAYAELVERVAAKGHALAGWTPGPTHRDFSPEHLMVDRGVITGIDLDEFCQYDRLFDVGHFVAHLRFLALVTFGGPAFDGLAARFQAAYAAAAPEYGAARVRLYEAIAYLKLMHIVVCVDRPADWEHRLSLLTGEASRLVGLI
jgi:hypothetical protein